MLSPAFTTALEKLNLQGNNLTEGEVGLLSYEFSNTLKQHFKDVVTVAYVKYKDRSFVVPPNFGHALIMLNRLLGFYFNVPELQKEQRPPQGELIKKLDQLLMMIVERLQHDDIFNEIKVNDELQKCLADLSLLQAYFAHEAITNQCLTIPPTTENTLLLVNKIILNARQSYKRIDTSLITYKNPLITEELTLLKQRLLHKIHVLECLFHPNAFGFKEIQFHLDRKNKLAQQRNSQYHGELIYNPKAVTQHQIDQHVLTALIEKIERIKNKQQPRTQFIVDIIGKGHAIVLDVSYDSLTNQIQMINIEPACLSFQAAFLEQLTTALKKRGLKPTTIAIQTGLLKDFNSCYTFSFALCSVVSQLSFATLLNEKEIPQPGFLHISDRITTDKVSGVSWRDVSVLGEKAVMMGQSFSEMRENLLKLFPEKTKEVDGMISDMKKSYGMGKTLPTCSKAEAHEESYIHLKRQSLRQKTKEDPYADITLAGILERMNVKTPGMALRRLASGFGRSRDMKFLINSHPEVINEKSEKTGRTALHFAYANNKLSRAYHLKKGGASQDILDKERAKPLDLKKI
jgi:hypothetical protein